MYPPFGGPVFTLHEIKEGIDGIYQSGASAVSPFVQKIREGLFAHGLKEVRRETAEGLLPDNRLNRRGRGYKG